jgi:hypothetical protein
MKSPAYDDFQSSSWFRRGRARLLGLEFMAMSGVSVDEWERGGALERGMAPRQRVFVFASFGC